MEISDEARRMVDKLYKAEGHRALDALARLCQQAVLNYRDSETKAEPDRAALLADMQAIDAIAVKNEWTTAFAISLQTIATIAARHRVEMDPLVEAFRVIQTTDLREGEDWSEGIARRLRAELAKRGINI